MRIEDLEVQIGVHHRLHARLHQIKRVPHRVDGGANLQRGGALLHRLVRLQPFGQPFLKLGRSARGARLEPALDATFEGSEVCLDPRLWAHHQSKAMPVIR